MENFAIKRIIYKHYNLCIEFFTYKPNILCIKNVYTISSNPIVIFKYINTHNMLDDKTSFNENAYKMTTKNQNKIIKFFTTIVSWFYDDNLKDLFLINDNEELVFNSDYRHIHVTLSKGKFDTGMMKAMPSVITIEDKKYEGVYLYINKLNNIIMITKEDIEEIANIIKNFNFINETASLLSIIDFSQRNNMVVTDMAEWTRITNPKSHGYVASVGKTPFDK